MNQDEALMDLCQALLAHSEVTSQPGWQKIILVGEVGEGHAGMRGYSYDADKTCLMVAPDGAEIEKLISLHAVMKAAHPAGRGWLKCMIRLSNAGDVGVDFEYDDPKRWSHTLENYKARMAEYAAMPV